ncbi:helix-turn-helix domain-containing protein [Paracoccus wurundjeri]|uniref:helix-turn-helix domain-containing protein n=1 Tax=Paracoccus onubensis TaxID=1675788 RepID=UPI00351D4874
MAGALLTPDEAADMLRVSTKTLQRLRGRGLPYVMITNQTIRYRPDDLENFIEGRIQQCRTARKTRASGTTTSKSGVVDFTAVAERTITRKPKR